MCAGAGAASEAPEAPLQRKPLETSQETATRPRHDHGGRRDPRGSGNPLFSLITLGRCLGEEPRTRSRPSSTFPGPAHLAEPRLVCHAPGPTNGAPLPAPGHEKPCCPAPLPRPGCAGSPPALPPEANPPLDLPTNPARGHFCSPIQNVRLSQPGPALPPANEPTRLSGPNTMNQDPRPGRTCHHVSPSRLSLDPAVSWLRFSPRTIYWATVSWLPSPPPTTRPPSRGHVQGHVWSRHPPLLPPSPAQPPQVDSLDHAQKSPWGQPSLRLPHRQPSSGSSWWVQVRSV